MYHFVLVKAYLQIHFSHGNYSVGLLREKHTHPKIYIKFIYSEKATQFEEVFLLVLKCQNKEGDVRLLWPSQKTSTLIAFSQEIDSHHSFYISSSIFYLTLN